MTQTICASLDILMCDFKCFNILYISLFCIVRKNIEQLDNDSLLSKMLLVYLLTLIIPVFNLLSRHLWLD
jgi:hypothetical protein